MARGSRVVLENRFAQHEAQMKRAFRQGLAAGAALAARRAESVPTTYRIEQIMRTRPLPVLETPNGFQTGIEAPDFRSLFFEKGTRGKKGAAKRSHAQKVEGGRGVKPVRFLKKGLKETAPLFPDLIKRAM